MKKIISILFVSIIVLLISFVCLKVKAVTYQKGDLRCPTSLVNSNVKCEEKKDSSGRVIEADIIYTFTTKDSTTVTLTKKVKKTDVFGRYSVQFVVAGDGSKQQKKDKNIYIDIIHDVSGSQRVVDEKGVVKQEIVRFSKLVFDNLDSNKTYISIDQFASTNESLGGKNPIFIQRPFNSDDLKSYGFWKSGQHYSHIDEGVKSAWKKFDKYTNSDDIRIALFFIDGGYLSSDKKVVEWKEARKYIDNFENAGIKIYVLRYKAWEGQKVEDIRKRRFISAVLGITQTGATPSIDQLLKNAKNSSLEELQAKENASETNFAAISREITDADSNEYEYDYEKAFEAIFNAINKEINEEEVDKLTSIEDVIGDDFYLSDGTARQKNFDMGPLVLEGKSSEVFYIDMNQSAPDTPANADGWHKTNEDFKLTYTGSETETVVIEDNPEVYWVNNNENIYSCSGTASADTTEISEATIQTEYYKKICYEGYEDSNGKYNKGFQVSIKIDNANDGQKSFGLLNGRGFPISAKLSTNVECTYTFNYEKFINDRNSLNSSYSSVYSSYSSAQNELNKLLNSSTGENPDEKPDEKITQKIAEIQSRIKSLLSTLLSLQNRLDNLNRILSNYKNLTASNDLSDLLEYKDRFEEQEAIVRVSYNNSYDYDELNLVPSKVSLDNAPTCSNGTYISSLGITTNKVCTIHLEKEMVLPETCLSMVDATQKDCTSGSNQLLSGGNRFYVDLEEDGGSVSVFVSNAGYYGDYNFQLDRDEKGGPACSFSNSTERVEFRQIDLSDPFLDDYNREVGENYLNDNYDFEKIIHGDTWDSKYEPEYYYEMSKTNVAKIKENTLADPSGSYLGQSCYFTNNNKWRCRFVRNELDGGTDNGTNWFYKFKPYEGIN